MHAFDGQTDGQTVVNSKTVCMLRSRMVKISYSLGERGDRYLAFFSPNSVALQADYVKVVEGRPIQSVTEM